MSVGHSHGSVTMWTPNMNSAVVKMLCHPSAPITSIEYTRCGNYMVTTGTDSRMKVWDMRTYALLHNYFTPSPVSSMSISQTGLLAVSFKDQIQVWKGWSSEKAKEPYMKHSIKQRSQIKSLKFVNYEDYLGIGHVNGFSSIVVPGSGDPNFDAFEQNPYLTKKQQREGDVHKLLEKIPYQTISLEH
jgi:U3 small nucleolar RNA-associated protein 7